MGIFSNLTFGLAFVLVGRCVPCRAVPNVTTALALVVHRLNL
jgi:hypothetical protein